MTARLLRDRLLAALAEMGGAVDHQRLAAEVLGIRGAPPELAKRLVAQALVVEDRRDAWRRAGERICGRAPSTPGVYVLKDEGDRPLYVGKAVNLRRRLRAHFADRRWKAIKPAFARAADAEWQEVGSELEALLREAALIDELKPTVNVQTASPQLDDRAIPQALLRDAIVVAPSVEDDSVELIAARVDDGGWMIQRTRRNGADLAVHANRLWRFFNSALRQARTSGPPLAPIVYSWLAGRGASATRLDPHAARSVQEMRRRLGALLRDERLFHERIEQW
jgi:predicted GIY-YIG superfamily endonuclease